MGLVLLKIATPDKINIMWETECSTVNSKENDEEKEAVSQLHGISFGDRSNGFQNVYWKQLKFTKSM